MAANAPHHRAAANRPELKEGRGRRLRVHVVVMPSALKAKVEDTRRLKAARQQLAVEFAKHKNKHPVGSTIWYDRGDMMLQVGEVAGFDEDGVAVRIAASDNHGVHRRHRDIVQVPWEMAFLEEEADELRKAWSSVRSA